MKKFIAASIILHLLPLLFIGPVRPTEEQQKQTEGQGQDTQKQSTGFDVDVIEQIPGDGIKKEPKAFYYGLGISGEYIMTTAGQVYLIHKVYAGYNGEAAGLAEGDIIVTVNGKSPVVEDISGDGPKKLILGVVRNNILLTILTERTRVYY